MKAITIKQPWASLIVDDLKDIENRTWKTKFRGRVLIHAGMDNKWEKKPISEVLTERQFNEYYDNEFLLHPKYHYGAIIGSVEIIGCIINHRSIWAEKTKPELWDENGKPIYDKPIYNWVLANPIKFDKPIYNVKGKLSFWDYEE